MSGYDTAASLLAAAGTFSSLASRGVRAMELWVGLGVIANNLLVLARAAAPKSGMPTK